MSDLLNEIENFNVGDKVIAIREYEDNSEIVNVTGTIRDCTSRAMDNLVLVYFDEDINGHEGSIELVQPDDKPKRCWWCDIDCLRLIDKFNITTNEDQYFNLLLGG